MLSETFSALRVAALRRDCHTLTALHSLARMGRLHISEQAGIDIERGPHVDYSDYLGLLRLADDTVERSLAFDDAMAEVSQKYRLDPLPYSPRCPRCGSASCVNAELVLTEHVNKYLQAHGHEPAAATEDK